MSSQALRALERWRNHNQGRLMELFNRVQLARKNDQLGLVEPATVEKAGRSEQILNSMSTIVRLMQQTPDAYGHSYQSFLGHGTRYIIHVNDLVRSVAVNQHGHAQWTHPSLQRSAMTALRAVRLIAQAVRRGWVTSQILFHLIRTLAQPLGDLFICLCVFLQQEQVNLESQYQTGSAIVLLRSTKALLGKEKLAAWFCCATQWFLIKVAQGSLPSFRKKAHLLHLHARVLSMQVALETTSHVCPPQVASLLPRWDPSVLLTSLRSLTHTLLLSKPTHESLVARAPHSIEMPNNISTFETRYVLPFLRLRSFATFGQLVYVPNVRRHLAEIPWQKYSGELLKALNCCGLVAAQRMRFRGTAIERGYDIEDFFCLWAKSGAALQRTAGSEKAFRLLTQDPCALASFERVVRQLLIDLGYAGNLELLLTLRPQSSVAYQENTHSSFPSSRFRQQILATQRLAIPYQPSIPFNTVIKLVSLFVSFGSQDLTRWHALIHCALAALTYHHGFSFAELETKQTRYVKTVRALMGLSGSTALATLPMLSRLREHVAARGPLPPTQVDMLLQAAVNGFATICRRNRDINVGFIGFVEHVVAPGVARRLQQCHSVDHRRAMLNRIMSDRIRPEEGWKGVRRVFAVAVRLERQRCDAETTTKHTDNEGAFYRTALHSAKIVNLLSDREEFLAPTNAR